MRLKFFVSNSKVCSTLCIYLLTRRKSFSFNILLSSQFIRPTIHLSYMNEKVLSEYYNRSESLQENCNIKQLMNKRLNCPNVPFSLLCWFLHREWRRREGGSRKFGGMKKMNKCSAQDPSRYHFLIAMCSHSSFSWQEIKKKDLFKLFMTDELKNLWG